MIAKFADHPCNVDGRDLVLERQVPGREKTTDEEKRMRPPEPREGRRAHGSQKEYSDVSVQDAEAVVDKKASRQAPTHSDPESEVSEPRTEARPDALSK